MTTKLLNIDGQNFDCNKNTAIEASAGTGKTYTITNMIVPFLLEQGYKLSEILIVTYTDKAAGELRSRIREELTTKSRNLDDKSSELKQKIDDEIEKIDDAPIFTIHSFCQKTLNENTIYANCSRNMKLIDEDAGLDIFIGKYIRDKSIHDKVLLYLYQASPQDRKNNTKQFCTTIKEAIKKYYLDKNGNEAPDIISLNVLDTQEMELYEQSVKIINNPDDATDDDVMPYDQLVRCFVTIHLPELYLAWQQEKQNKNLQTYGDMIKNVYDALIQPESRLLSELKKKYKYAIIDEFQDTNQLQWNIFKQIFTTDNEHHISIVGDPKQSIFSFQGADSKVYNVAKQYIMNHDGDVIALEKNYRSSGIMIDAVNMLAGDPYICDCSKMGGYQDVQIPSPENLRIQPAQIDGKNEKPVHIIYEPGAEDVIISKIREYCHKKLQIWNKKTKTYRDVNYGDFAVLVRKRFEADKLIKKMTGAGIPFMWHKDPSVFTTKEGADWIALLSAIQVPDFNAKNRDILRQALQSEFFDVSIDNINDEKYNDLVCHERQLLLKWHNLAETRNYAKLLDSIFQDSGITKRLAGYDKIQSLSKYNQIGNFVLDYLVSKHGSITTVIKALKRQKAKNKEEDELSVEKPTDNPTVKLSTIHSAKGLEYPIVFYWVRKQSKSETQFVHLVHGDGKTVLNIQALSLHDPDWDALRYVAITRSASLLFLINTMYYNRKTKEYEYVMGKMMAKKHPKLVVDESLYDQDDADNTETMDNIDNTTDAAEFPGTIPLARKKLYKHSYTSLSHRAIYTTDSDPDDTELSTEDAQRVDKEDADTVDIVSTKMYDTKSVVKISDIYDFDKIMPISMDSERGAKYGTAVHEMFEQIDFTQCKTNDMSSWQKYVDSIIHNKCKKHSIKYSDDIVKLITNTLCATLPEIIGNHVTGKNFSLSSLPQTNKKSETEFNFDIYLGKTESLTNYCNGFIDLLFVREINGTNIYSILDWKTDLFDNPSDYAHYDYLKSHVDDKYAIQRVLYSYCLIQWLKQFYPDKGVDEIFNTHFGGVYYVFVRGCYAGTCNGIYAHTWDNYAALEKAFQEIIKGIYNG